MVSVNPQGTKQTTSASARSANQSRTVDTSTTNKTQTIQGINDLSKYYADLAKKYAEQALVSVDEEINNVLSNAVGTGNVRVSYINNVLTIENYTFEFEQAVSSDRWVINHNLNKKPSVTIVDSSGNVFEPAVSYEDENTCIAEMLGATTGKAYLN